MSARGARSRKDQQKDIQKRGKRIAIEGKAVEEHVPHDKLTSLPLSQVPRNKDNIQLSRSATASSHASSRSSSTNNSHGRSQLKPNPSTEHGTPRVPYSSTRDPASISGISEGVRGKPGYDTFAPAPGRRYGGREGIVKNHAAASRAPSQPIAESRGPYRPPADQNSWKDFKVWEGAKKNMRPYGGFEVDEDMQYGSVLIYFKEEQTQGYPPPFLRADLKTLENAGSTWITNALSYGRIDNGDDEWMLPSNSKPMFPSQPTVQENLYSGQRCMLLPISPGGQSPPPLNIDQHYGTVSSASTSSAPPYSDCDRSDRSNSPRPFQQSDSRDHTHEIWFTAPDSTKTPQEQRLYHVAVRNYLAMLHDKPIVGADLFDMLSTLLSEIQIMCDFDACSQSRITPRERSVQMLTNYLGQHGVDDIRNNPKCAMGLLAWSEQEGVKWRQGYLESFVHLAGSMSPNLEALSEFKRLSVVTRRNLGIASKTLQLRVMEAEKKLSTFDFGDLWGDISKVTNNPVYQSYQSFRQFLTKHYAHRYDKWPPTSTSLWLNRKLVAELQDDLGLLYDYLVDRDVIWSPCEERASRKWEMAHRRLEDFKADLPELGMTDMLIGFDGKHRFAHIPHPYPLLPDEVSRGVKESKKGLFASLKRDKNKSKNSTQDAKAQLQLSIVFGDATNIERLGASYTGSALIDKFEQFELNTNTKHVTPREARLGHWVLLYGILQVLSILSVDVQGLKHTDDVHYFLCADLNRCPEWVTNKQLDRLQANQQRSWCWQRSWDPSRMQTAPVELDVWTDNEPAQEDKDSANNTNRHRNTTFSSSPSFLLAQTPSLDHAAHRRRNNSHTDHHHHHINTNLPATPPPHTAHPHSHYQDPDTPDGFVRPAFLLVENPQPERDCATDSRAPSPSLAESPVAGMGEFRFGAGGLGWPVPPGYEKGSRDGPWM